uniref:Protein kinase domain-containing protein n=1 Tax=Cynoglossus semilaevis TaxID=244447 RepID=A0A3P8VFR3_CYNSE
MDEEASATDDFVPLIESSGYRVEDLLGSGNFGRVYLCTRSDTLEAVAVKAIPKKDAEFVKDEANFNANSTVTYSIYAVANI